MSAPLTVADALALSDLPAPMRAQIAAEIRRAYLAGYAEARTMAMADNRTGLRWLAVHSLDQTCADLWQWDEVRPLLGVEAGT